MGADLIIMGEREIALGIIQKLFEWQAHQPSNGKNNSLLVPAIMRDDPELPSRAL
jgi:hypothetical protein